MVLDASLKFLSAFANKKAFQPSDADRVDAMHIFSSSLLVAFAVITGYNTFSSSPLSCADTEHCMAVGCHEVFDGSVDVVLWIIE